MNRKRQSPMNDPSETCCRRRMKRPPLTDGRCQAYSTVSGLLRRHTSLRRYGRQCPSKPHAPEMNRQLFAYVSGRNPLHEKDLSKRTRLSSDFSSQIYRCV